MTDESIMAAVKGGDLQQAALLFERYHKRIFNFLAKMVMDRDTAADLTQNVFLRVIRYKTSFRDGSRFKPWIYQIARNVFSDHYQRAGNRYSGFVDVEKVKDHIAEEHEWDQEEKEQLLHRSMERLTAEQRELLVLTRFQQLKYEEVAEILDTTVANVKVKVHRAIAKLREHYFELEKI